MAESGWGSRKDIVPLVQSQRGSRVTWCSAQDLDCDSHRRRGGRDARARLNRLTDDVGIDMVQGAIVSVAKRGRSGDVGW